MSRPLSQRLREETNDAHLRAERSGIMRSLLRGIITRDAYVVLLRNLAGIYGPLEEELGRHADHPALIGIDLVVLRRLPALERDITALDIDPSQHTHTERRATQDYAARLREVGRSSPELLLAHAYVRYMGDLSGGLMLEKMVAKTLEIGNGDDGLAFYAFPLIPDPVGFKQAFRGALDAAACVVKSPDAIVREAQHAFALHERLFRELA